MSVDELRAALADAEQDLRVASRARGLAEGQRQAAEFADSDAAMKRAAGRFVAARDALARHDAATI